MRIKLNMETAIITETVMTRVADVTKAMATAEKQQQ